jgi:hypothetical protein
MTGAIVMKFVLFIPMPNCFHLEALALTSVCSGLASFNAGGQIHARAKNNQ